MHELAIIPVHARPHPMSMEVFHAEFPAGLTIAEILGPEAKSCHVEIGGMTVPEEWWIHVRPKPGHAVVITRYPQGGSSAKSIFRIIAFAALAIGVALISGGALAELAFIPGNLFAAGTLSAGLLAAGVGLGGALLINALIPPQSSALSAANATSSSTNLLNAITGTGNQTNRYGSIPCAIGEVLYYPTYAALPYTELSGDDQYLRCLFDLGYGDPDPSEMKIGDSDLSTYTDVETEIGVSPGLFSQDVTEAAAGNVLNTDGDTATRTSSNAADEGSIDLQWAGGLFAIDSNGNIVTVTCIVKVEYAPTGTGAWTDVSAAIDGFTLTTPAASDGGDGTIHVVNGERKAIRLGVRWKYPTSGQYDVKVTRISTDYGSTISANQVGDLTWTVIRSIRYSTVSTTGTKKLAMRIKATDQLSGNISQFNCILSQPIPVWHAGTSTWVTEFSTNPAYVFRWLLRDCPANPRRVDESRIDDAGVIQWAAECDAKEYTYSNTLDTATTLYPLLKDVCAAGRASFNIKNGMYGVIRDELQTTPVQVFTPRNSWGFGGNRAFPDAVQALRVQFINEEASFQQDERIVYDDGYGDQFINAIPNGDLTVNLAGWTTPGGFSAATYATGMVLGVHSAAASPVFPVVPGKTYRFTFTGKQTGPGTQLDYHRVSYGATAAAALTVTVSNIHDFLGAGSIAAVLTNYQYDWVCPSGVFFAAAIVYQDGTAQLEYTQISAYDFAAAQATSFEQMPIAGCTNANAAWRLGRYHLAVGRRRPNTYFWNADVENLVCSRGDLVLFANDVIGVGIAQGRIKSTTEVDPTDPSSPIASIVLDEQVVGDEGTTYAVRVRRTGGTVDLSVATLGAYGEPTSLINLTTPLAGISPGDLVLFGVMGQDSIPLVITKIEPGADLSAKITAVDASYDVLDADSGPIPEFISQITGQPWLDAPNPPDLIIVDSGQIQGPPNDAGNTSPVVSVTVTGSWSGPIDPSNSQQLFMSQ